MRGPTIPACRSSRNTAIACWLTAIGIAALASAMKQRGYLINETGSLPVGLWRMTPFLTARARGTVVSICPPNTAAFSQAYQRGYLSKGRCASGFEPLLKPLAAIPGDEIEIIPEGIQVNGVLIQNSARLLTDVQG